MTNRTNAGRAFCLVLAYFTAALLGGWLLRGQGVFVDSLTRLPVAALLLLNAFFVFSGIPLSALGDLLLLKKVGLPYLAYWPFFVGIASCTQIFFFRSSLCKAWFSPFHDRLRRRSQGVMPGKTGQAFFVLLIRAVPLLPFLVGSFVISVLPRVSRSTVFGLSLLGCYLYYTYFGAGFLLGTYALGS